MSPLQLQLFGLVSREIKFLVLMTVKKKTSKFLLNAAQGGSNLS